MRHQNSVFHSILKHVPWVEFDRLVAAHKADARLRRLTTKSQFVALLYGQLSGASSLREIVTGLQSHAMRLYHVGAMSAQRSTLADANAQRVPIRVCWRAGASDDAGAPRTAPEAGRSHLSDRCDRSASEHAERRLGAVSHKAVGVKLHVIYAPDADRPIYAVMSPANVNDITVAQAVPITRGTTYVLTWAITISPGGPNWMPRDAIVTRFKSNTPLAAVADLPVPSGGTILSDRIGHLPRRQCQRRQNPFQGPVREVRVTTERGKVLRILCNDLDATAEEIADLYKRRWAVELFFRLVKQTLKITRFLGTSENAVRIQIAVALIAFLLLRLAQPALRALASLLAFARLVRANLMHRRPLDQLHRPPIPINHRQLILELAHG